MFKKRDKKTGIWIVILAATIIALAVVIYFNNRPPVYIAQDLSRIDTAQVAQILIKQNGKVVNLFRSNGLWFLANQNNYPVSPTLVGNVLSSLQKIQNQGVQAWGQDKIAESGLNAESKDVMRLQLRNDGNQILTDWLIGREIGYQEFLAREASSDQILNLRIPQLPKLDIAYWVTNIWQGLEDADFTHIILGIGEQQTIDLARTDADQDAWKIANLPKGRELRPDSQIVKLPNIFVGQNFIAAQPLGNLKITGAQRWRSQFTTSTRLEITITQARDDGKTYTHFAARAIDPAQQDWANRFNKTHGQWAYEMGEDFNNLLSLRMPSIIKGRNAATS